MSKKKKNKAPAAQQLIDSLLDENTSAAKKRPDYDSTTVGSSVDDDEIDFSAMGEDLPDEIILEDGRTMHVRDEDISDKSEPKDATSLADFQDLGAVNLSIDGQTFGGRQEQEEKAGGRAGFHANQDDDGERTNVIPFATVKRDLKNLESSLSDELDQKVDQAAETFPAMASESPEAQDAHPYEIPADDDVQEEKTVRLPPPAVAKSSNDDLFPERTNQESPRKTPIDRSTSTEIKPGGGAYGSSQHKRPLTGPATSVFTSAEAALKQSESLRIAQSRITDLEQELERLRRENERLGSAGETLRRRSDELLSKIESSESQSRESQRILEEEKRVIRGQLSQKDRENAELRQRLDELENRLESNFKKIRVRERELEHRLEIIKMESATLVSTKDKMILELKRQVDQLTHENEYGKQKSQELFNQFKDKQDTIRRVVRALRIALTILEGDEENNVPFKKTD